jgi:hypothetical protein
MLRKEERLNGYKYILTKQTEWAKNRGIALIGSKCERGYPSYVRQVNDNLFQPLLPEVLDALSNGDGNELGSPGSPGKMQAVHSSSALGVNVFQYWMSVSEVPVIAAACGLCRRGSSAPSELKFEEKYAINDNFGVHPNIDIVIHNRQADKIQRLAIECKFSEAYGAHKHGGIKNRYLVECGTLWDDIPNLRKFAETICPDDSDFRHLHPAQLIKHILGLKRSFGRNGFRLLYLWYDVVGEEGSRHRDEINQFAAIAKGDGVMFHSLSYQDLICGMANQLRSEHEAYISYLTERYL